MLDFNQYFNFHDTQDKDTLRDMVDEIIDIYGIPMIHRKYNGNAVILDPLYGDMPTKYVKDETLYVPKEAKVYVDYKNFNMTLYSYGHANEENSLLEGMMKLTDAPAEGDVVDFVRPFDGVKYRFQINDSNIYKDLCYSVILLLRNTENAEELRL